MKERRFVNDILSKIIYRDYIKPKDAIHTARIMEITKKYGFPGVKRIKQYYNKEFSDPKFSTYILLVHAPKSTWKN